MSGIKIWCRLFAGGFFFVFGLFGQQMLSRAAELPSGNRQAYVFLIGAGCVAFGFLVALLLWWMGNVHDYLRDIRDK